MDGQRIVDRVETARETELDRLGSSAQVVALTGADLSTDAVLAAAAAGERAAAQTVQSWADDEDDDRVADAFATVAAVERDHYDRVIEAAPGDLDLPEGPDALDAHLRTVEDTVGRVAAGLVGRPLAAERVQLQVVSFFVNEADESRADLFRDLRTDTRDQVDRGADLLDATCADDADWDRAEAAATETVDVVYEDYAETLDGLGLDPKSIC